MTSHILFRYLGCVKWLSDNVFTSKSEMSGSTCRSILQTKELDNVILPSNPRIVNHTPTQIRMDSKMILFAHCTCKILDIWEL